MLEEFRKFALRGNVVDLAIGVIIGAAFGAIVQSVVGDILMPIIGAADEEDPPRAVPHDSECSGKQFLRHGCGNIVVVLGARHICRSLVA